MHVRRGIKGFAKARRFEVRCLAARRRGLEADVVARIVGQAPPPWQDTQPPFPTKIAKPSRCV